MLKSPLKALEKRLQEVSEREWNDPRWITVANATREHLELLDPETFSEDTHYLNWLCNGNNPRLRVDQALEEAQPQHWKGTNYVPAKERSSTLQKKLVNIVQEAQKKYSEGIYADWTDRVNQKVKATGAIKQYKAEKNGVILGREDKKPRLSVQRYDELLTSTLKREWKTYKTVTGGLDSLLNAAKKVETSWFKGKARKRFEAELQAFKKSYDGLSEDAKAHLQLDKVFEDLQHGINTKRDGGYLATTVRRAQLDNKDIYSYNHREAIEKKDHLVLEYGAKK